MGFAESISDPRLATLHAYWSAKRAQNTLPSRSDIDPGDLRALLSHILLIDVIEGGRDFRYRLVGTEIERHIGRPVTGRLVGETLSGGYLAYIRGLHLRVIAEAKPVYSENNFTEGSTGFALIADFKRAFRLMLPLSRDGRTVDMLLCGQVFAPIRDGSEPDVLLVDDGR
jgi:hypothetical protein